MGARTAVGLVALFGLFASGGAAAGASGDLEAIRLAVFRQQVPFWLAEHARESNVVVCLATEEKGVRRAVAEQYLSHVPGEPAVRTAQACDERASGAVELRTGRPAILLSVGEVVWKSPQEAWVKVWHYRTATVSGVRTQRVVREGAEWVCVGQIIEGVPVARR